MTRETAWLDAALAAIGVDEPVALVTVAEAKGSTPREAGAKMLVRATDIVGSIGGGQLEMIAVDTARRLLREGATKPSLISHSLGPDLGQCCGGAVRLLVEPLAAQDRAWLEDLARHHGQAERAILCTFADGRKSWAAERAGFDGCRVELLPEGWCVVEAIRQPGRPLWLFGAGHVGRAVATVLAELDFEVTWLDSRQDGFPSQVPPGVRRVVEPQLASALDWAPAGCLFLVMTHSHQLDLEICDRILRRRDFAFLGLIGSATKKARFVSALKARGHEPPALEQLTCPVGLAQIPGKQPMAIAVSVAAQLLALPLAADGSGDEQNPGQELRGAG